MLRFENPRDNTHYFWFIYRFVNVNIYTGVECRFKLIILIYHMYSVKILKIKVPDSLAPINLSIHTLLNCLQYLSIDKKIYVPLSKPSLSACQNSETNLNPISVWWRILSSHYNLNTVYRMASNIALKYFNKNIHIYVVYLIIFLARCIEELNTGWFYLSSLSYVPSVITAQWGCSLPLICAMPCHQRELERVIMSPNLLRSGSDVTMTISLR